MSRPSILPGPSSGCAALGRVRRGEGGHLRGAQGKGSRDAGRRRRRRTAMDASAQPAAALGTAMADTPVPDGLGRGPSPGLRRPTWVVKPPAPMRKATFGVPAGSAEADLSITAFPGDVGGELANINRWRGQVGLDAAQGRGLGRLGHPRAGERPRVHGRRAGARRRRSERQGDPRRHRALLGFDMVLQADGARPRGEGRQGPLHRLPALRPPASRPSKWTSCARSEASSSARSASPWSCLRCRSSSCSGGRRSTR